MAVFAEGYRRRDVAGLSAGLDSRKFRRCEPAALIEAVVSSDEFIAAVHAQTKSLREQMVTELSSDAEGPISVHVLEGEIAFEAEGRTWTLGPGDLLALAHGIPHAVRSERGGVFLLTVVLPPGAGSGAPQGNDAHAG